VETSRSSITLWPIYIIRRSEDRSTGSRRQISWEDKRPSMRVQKTSSPAGNYDRLRISEAHWAIDASHFSRSLTNFFIITCMQWWLGDCYEFCFIWCLPGWILHDILGRSPWLLRMTIFFRRWYKSRCFVHFLFFAVTKMENSNVGVFVGLFEFFQSSTFLVTFKRPWNYGVISPLIVQN